MESYVDYTFYKEDYLGKLPKNMFLKQSREAQALVDLYTFNRIKRMPEEERPIEVKCAVCNLIDHLHKEEDENSKEIASESVDTHSVSYVTSIDKAAINIDFRNNIYGILLKWLGNTGLMFKGVK